MSGVMILDVQQEELLIYFQYRKLLTFILRYIVNTLLLPIKRRLCLTFSYTKMVRTLRLRAKERWRLNNLQSSQAQQVALLMRLFPMQRFVWL